MFIDEIKLISLTKSPNQIKKILPPIDSPTKDDNNISKHLPSLYNEDPKKRLSIANKIDGNWQKKKVISDFIIMLAEK